MKKTIMKLMFIMLLYVCMTACYEDKGNYDYTPLPDVKMENLKESYTVTQFDTLNITPEVSLPEGNYEYSWRIWINQVNGSESITISHEKNLAYEVLESPGNYVMVYTITNKDTQVSTYKTMQLIIQGLITEGWLVLHEKEGKTDFDLLMSPYFSRRVTKDIELRNLYESINGEPLPGGRGVSIANYNAGSRQYVYVLTENAGVRLSAVTMQKMYDLSSLMVDGRPLKPQSYSWLPWGNMTYLAEMLVSDGRFYMAQFGDNLFAEPVFKDGGTYKASPYLGWWLEWTLRAVLYDELHGRFLRVANNVLTFMEFPPAPGALFDLNRMNGHLVYMEDGFNKYEYAVIQDWTTGKRILYVINFLTEDNQYAVALYNTDGCPEFGTANCFAVGSRGNVFYYATEDKVYQYDYSGSNTASVVLEASPGEKITCMELMKPNEDYYVTSQPYDNKVLVIATHNETTGEGKIYMYYLNEANGALDKSSQKVYAGFGEIIDIEYNYYKYGS